MPDSVPRILLVEGENEKHVIRHLIDRGSGVVAFQAEVLGGIDPLTRALPNYVVRPGLEALGVVADANDDIEGRWQSIKDRLSSRGVELPRSLSEGGTIIPATDENPRVGVWLMPDNQSAGELEHFVAQMIPTDDPVWWLACDYVASIPADLRLFRPQKEMRAQVHAWLATREDPRQMGLAIRTRDLDTQVPLVATFISWLKRLFGDSNP